MLAKRKLLFGLFLLGAGLIALVGLLTPQTASADAGPGGGGGQSGCDEFQYSTCYGAVWRYYYTSSDSYAIPNVNPGVNGNTYVTGCGSKTGGFFAYVLVSKWDPGNASKVRSWKIGPVDGYDGNKSEFFGGWTKYLLYSNPSDTLPNTLAQGGMYSWYAAKTAFDKTVAAGQNNGFAWNGSSQLGWFCYRHADYNLNPVVDVPAVSADPSTTIQVKGTIDNTGSTDSANAAWQLNTFTITPDGNVPNGGDNNIEPRTHFGNGATEVNSGSGSRVFPANPTITVWDSTRKLGELPIGTKVCFALSVKPAGHANAGWRHSTPDCVVISKKPKVQVLGGDLIVGRGAAASSVKSKVVTSTTTAFKDPVEIDAPASSFSGLWLTGVDASNAPLAPNAPDPHWIVDRAYRPQGTSGNVCQSIVTGNISSTTVKTLLTTSANPQLPARVIGQSAQGAGLYTSKNQSVTGNQISASVTANEDKRVWARTASNARWIGINQYGQNYSRNGCTDPTFNQGTNMANANIYVFKLKDGFNISAASLVKLETVRLSLRGGVDNQIRFYVNGVDLGDWQEPGWNVNSSATSTAKGGVFKYGNNSLEIHIKSTYSHTGLLIDQLTMTAKALATADRTYGSWTEYGMAPAGTVTGMASAAGFANGALNGALCPSKSLLTFSNIGATPVNSACNESVLGGYAVASASPFAAISTRFTPSAGVPVLSGTVDIASLQSDRVYQANSNITLTSTGNIPKGKWVVIKALNNNVTINSNITYTNEALNRVSELPQVVIMANNITINRGVSRVDSWLLAQGTGTNGALKTCDVTNQSDLTSRICETRLRINGPVIANRLLLYRTGGAEPGNQSGVPAEIFNIRPDAYLWATEFASSTGRLPTVSTKELPPRF